MLVTYTRTFSTPKWKGDTSGYRLQGSNRPTASGQGSCGVQRRTFQVAKPGPVLGLCCGGPPHPTQRPARPLHWGNSSSSSSSSSVRPGRPGRSLPARPCGVCRTRVRAAWSGLLLLLRRTQRVCLRCVTRALADNAVKLCRHAEISTWTLQDYLTSVILGRGSTFP